MGTDIYTHPRNSNPHPHPYPRKYFQDRPCPHPSPHTAVPIPISIRVGRFKSVRFKSLLLNRDLSQLVFCQKIK